METAKGEKHQREKRSIAHVQLTATCPICTLSATLNMTVPFYSRSRNLTLYRTLSVRSNVERAAGPAARDLELGACLLAVCAQERRIPALSAPPESMHYA